MARLTTVQQDKGVDTRLFPVLFGKDLTKKKLSKKEQSTVEIFEKGLANELSRTDTIEQSVNKIVKMALVCEFGTGLITKPGAKAMIETISKGILGSRELRRSALIIADRFAGSKKSKTVTLRGKNNKALNG